MRLTYLGHSAVQVEAVQVETSEHTLLIDPFISGYPLATVAADEFSAECLIVEPGMSLEL